jgi:hypothetical protein
LNLFYADFVFSCQKKSKSPFWERFVFSEIGLYGYKKNPEFMLTSNLKELFRKSIPKR